MRVIAAGPLVAACLTALGLAAWRPATRRPSRVPGPEPGASVRPTPRRAAPLALHQLVAEAGLPLDADHIWGALTAGAVLAVALTAVLAGPLLALVVAAALVASPSILRPLLEQRARDRRDRQLPAALERLAASLRSGSALAPAIVGLASSAPEPLGAELRSVAAEVQHGAALRTALARWAARPQSSPEVRLTAAALALGAEAGGGVARSVDRVAATLRERNELRAEVQALATQAKASAGVLVAAPIAFMLLVSTVEPTVVRFLVTSPLGVACLAGGAGLELLGAAWMARILRSVSP